MPVFQGQINEDGLLQLIVYIKSLSTPASTHGRQADAKQPPRGIHHEHDLTAPVTLESGPII